MAFWNRLLGRSHRGRAGKEEAREEVRDTGYESRWGSGDYRVYSDRESGVKQDVDESRGVGGSPDRK
jgi:hypothetical protein